jgi:hypothetical protein
MKTLPDIAVRADGRFQGTMQMSCYHQMCVRTFAPLTKEQVRGLFQLKDDSGLISDFREEEA